MNKQAIPIKKYNLYEIREVLASRKERLIRERYSNTTLRGYLERIEPKSVRIKYLEFYDSHPDFKVVCAGAKHHHYWRGGLENHCCEMIGIAMDLISLYTPDFIQFDKSDAIIAIFLHDFNKIWIYREITLADREKDPKKYHERQVFTYKNDSRAEIIDGYSMILLELAKFGIIPSDIQWSAVLFHESAFSPAAWSFGGPSKTLDTVNKRNHLATLVNMVDNYSSQILGKSLI